MKEELRKKYLDIRKNIINEDELNNKIYYKVVQNNRIKSAKTILIYVSFNNEVDTIKIIKYFLGKKLVAVPKIENNEMNFYYINNVDELKMGKYHILEPITDKKVIEFKDTVSLTPGICYSKDGYRIGYGKGYYDKFYKKNKVYSIGLCFKECILENIPHDSFDQKVNEIITD